MSDAIKFTPTAKQKEAHRLLKCNRIVLYGGAVRGAKSYWGCMEIISFCFQYPNSRWLMLRQSLPTIRSTLLKTFTENFLNNGFQQFVRDFNQQTLVLTWNNDSQIIFMAESYDSDKELNRFRGLEINGAFIDEVNEIQEATFDKVIERAGSWFHSKGCPTKILMSCNPTQNWVKQRFYNRWKEGKLPQGQAYIQARITDNPHVPQSYLDGLNDLPRFQYEVFVNGDWEIVLKTGGEFYKCFELDMHVAPTAYDPIKALHISWDDNVNPYLPCGIFQIEIVMVNERAVGWHLKMIDEIAGVSPRNTIKSVCAEVVRKFPNHQSGLFVYGDATANKQDTKLEKGYNFYRIVLDELRQYKPNLRVLSSNPSVVMRGNFINTILEKEYGGIKITIGENCKKTINDLVSVKEAADGTKLKEMETDNETKVRYQKVGHFSDLLDYVVVSAFANQFAQYQRGGKDLGILQGKSLAKHGY